MSLVRKQIRKNILGILYGATSAGDNVRFNRSEKNWHENLPAISCFLRGETLTEHSQAPRIMKRSLSLVIEIVDKGQDGEDLNDKLDELAEQVERVMSIDDSIGGCANDIYLSSVSDVETESDGTQCHGALRLIYDIEFYEYFPRDRKGQGSFVDFTIYADWDLEGEQAAADRATDNITP